MDEQKVYHLKSRDHTPTDQEAWRLLPATGSRSRAFCLKNMQFIENETSRYGIINTKSEQEQAYEKQYVKLYIGSMLPYSGFIQDRAFRGIRILRDLSARRRRVTRIESGITSTLEKRCENSNPLKIGNKRAQDLSLAS